MYLIKLRTVNTIFWFSCLFSSPVVGSLQGYNFNVTKVSGGLPASLDIYVTGFCRRIPARVGHRSYIFYFYSSPSSSKYCFFLLYYLPNSSFIYSFLFICFPGPFFHIPSSSFSTPSSSLLFFYYSLFFIILFIFL